METLRRYGNSVAITSGARFGFPDLVVGRNGDLWLLEVKKPGPPSNQALSPAERYFIENWKGKPVAIVTTPEEALRAVGQRPEES